MVAVRHYKRGLLHRYAVYSRNLNLLGRGGIKKNFQFVSFSSREFVAWFKVALSY